MKTKYDVIIGIDIGLKGAICFWDVFSEEILSISDMPVFYTQTSTGRKKGNIDIKKLAFHLEVPKIHGDNAIVILEDVHAFPGQGSVAVGTLLEQKGIIRGLICGLGYDEVLVNPKTWQHQLGLIAPKSLKGHDSKITKALRNRWIKEKSIAIAKEKFPEWSVRFDGQDGRSDACLIANYYSNILEEINNESETS